MDKLMKYLNEAEQRRALELLDASEDICVTLTLLGQLEWANRAWSSVLGYPAEPLSLFELVHPDDAPATYAAFDRLQAGAPLSRFEHRLQHADGSYLWLQWNAHRLKDSDIIFGIARDVTGDKLSQLQLEASEMRFRSLFDTTSIGIMLVDAQGYIDQTNDAVTAIFGYAAGALRQVHIHRLLPGLLKLEATKMGVPVIMDARKRSGERFSVEITLDVLKTNGSVLTVVFVSDKSKQLQHQQLKLLEAAVANISESIIITEATPIDEPGPRIVYVNQAFTKTTGYSAEEVIGRSPRFLQGEKTDKQALRRIREALIRQSSVQAEIINYRKDGSEFHNSMQLAPVRDQLGHVSHFVAIQSDITQRKQQELLASYRREIFELIAMQATLADIMTRLITLIELNNPGLMVAVHYRRADHLALAHAPSLPESFRDAFKHLSLSAPGTDLYRLVHAKAPLVVTDILGRRQWRRYHRAARETGIQSCWSQPIVNEADHVCGAISMVSREAREPTAQERDLLTEASQLAAIAMSQRRLLAQLEHQALYDAVTGLGNRKYMRDRLQQRLGAAAQPQKFAVVVLDIDNFREVNDSHSHAVGDTLLHNVATRLKSLLAPQDVLTRLHGDEFGLILGFDGHEGLEHILMAIERSLGQTFMINDSLIDITVSMGISLYPNDGQTADELLMFADGALHATKADGKRGYRYYHPSIRAQLNEQLELSRDLKRALTDGGLTLFYQPRADAKTRETVAAEALIRWQHPTRGLLPPAAFLGAAEKAGLMMQLDMWVLREACEQLHRWQREQLPYRLSCNISAASFNDDAFAERVIALLDDMQIDTDKLELEITEDMLLKNPEQAASQLTKLKTAYPGLHVAIDDFGTGYSSLAYLRYLPVDTLKIDRLFVRDLDSEQHKTQETAQAVINTVVLLGHQLKLMVVAEGTETSAQIEALAELGCDQIQGYAYGRPMPIADFLRTVKGNRRSALTL
jgi:diguanylate cyclase (GGDEF)-like protein/PAS domain S-box-containing protein